MIFCGLTANAQTKVLQTPDEAEYFIKGDLSIQRNSKGNVVEVQLAATQKYGMYPQKLLEGVVQVKEDTDLQQFKTVHKNDYVISLRSFQGGFEMSDYEGVCSPAYQVFYNTRKIEYKYFKYLFKCDGFISKMNSLTVGIREGKNIQYKDFAESFLPVPSLTSQLSLITFLDKKCSEIDAVIEQTKATIEEYKKLKQSIITEAVTKGIRGNRPMKDSGNIWYGCIPSEWDIRKLKYVFTIKKDIAGKEGYTVLSITQKGVVPKNISSNEGQLAENYSNYQLVAIGDFAMNHMDLLTGWVDISQYEGVTSPDYRVFVLNDTINNCKQYYLYLMQMCYSNRIFYGLGQGVSGMGRWRLQADKFLNFTIPIPPTQEQQEIADYLDQKCVEIDALVTKKEQIVVELEAYKKSLIYEVVTGKRSV